MANSRIPATIDKLVSLFEGAGLLVFDGPVPTGDYTVAVFVGYDATGQNSELRSVSSTQSWASIAAGRGPKNENFTVICGLASVDGANVTKNARDAVYAALATVADVLRSDPSLGFSSPYVANLSSGDLYTFASSAGIECRLPFEVSVQTRI